MKAGRLGGDVGCHGKFAGAQRGTIEQRGQHGGARRIPEEDGRGGDIGLRFHYSHIRNSRGAEASSGIEVCVPAGFGFPGVN
jgi:hypothetical protein